MGNAVCQVILLAGGTVQEIQKPLSSQVPKILLQGLSSKEHQMTPLLTVQLCWETCTQDVLDQGPELLPCFYTDCVQIKR